MTSRSSLRGEVLIQAALVLIQAALAEREAERACRDRPWEDRAAWLAYVEALVARRAAVDALIKERVRVS